MNDYKTILFDLDGTVTDPIEGITKCVQYALAKLGIEADLESLTPYIGPPLQVGFKELAGLNEEEVVKAIAYYRERFIDVGMFENEVYSGMEELLHELCERGYQLVIATSKPTVFAERILKHFELNTYFDWIIGSNLDGTRIHKAEIIKEALAKYEDAGKVVMIGDRMHDIVGANENGIESIGVLFGYGSEQELREAGATYLAKSVEDLLLIIERGDFNV